MTKSIGLGAREDHPFSLHTVAAILDTAIREGVGFDPDGVKASWLADQIGMSEGCLSNYRNATRPLPAWAIPEIDTRIRGHRLLAGLAALEGCGIFETAPTSMTIPDLEALHELVQRTHGQADAELTKALRDRRVSEDERVIVHPLAAKMRRFWQDIEERTAPAGGAQ